MKYTSYMYFDYDKRKVPLYNSENYKVEVSKDSSLIVSPQIERLFVAYLNYQTPEKAKREIHICLNNYYKDLSYPLQEKFIEKFIKDHPAQPVESAEIPLHAVNGIFSFIVNPANLEISLTDEQEKELVEIIKQYKTKSKKKIMKWFIRYYWDRGDDLYHEHDIIENIASELIASKGYVVSNGFNMIQFLNAMQLIWQVLVYTLGAIAIIAILISLLPVLFK